MPSTRLSPNDDAPAAPGLRPSTDNLAAYNNTVEDILPSNLREDLDDVLAYIFPLSADPTRMQNFLDRYLNFPGGTSLEDAPPVYFKPAAPFVLLEVANYGRLSSNIANAGWFAQREIAFGMAVEWYARQGDALTFLKYALIYPYVYVDSPLGIAGGREIYGWSKAPIEVALLRRHGENSLPVPLAPVFNPPGELLLLAANRVIPGRTPRSDAFRRRLIEIRQGRYLQATSSLVTDVLSAVPRAIGASLNTGWEALKFMLNSAQLPSRQLGSLLAILPAYGRMIANYLPAWLAQAGAYSPDRAQVSTPTSIITFKQVRDIDDERKHSHQRACYQGIVESQMLIKSISNGGSLVDATNPDPAAGIYIDLFEQEEGAGPLELGIHYQLFESTPDPSKSWGEESRRYRIVPFLPFWVKMDLRYGLANYQAWRTTWSDWTENNTPQLREKRLDIPYIKLGAGAAEEIPAPTQFPHLTMRILPLAADYTKIAALIANYLGNAHPAADGLGSTGYFDFAPIRFPEGSAARGHAAVLAILSNFEEMETVSARSIRYDDYEFTFAVPVIWTNNYAKPKTSGVGLVSIYTFAGTTWNAITSAEVYGRWTLQATFDSAPFPFTLPPRAALTPELRICTQLFPDGAHSEEVLDLPVIEIAASYAGDQAEAEGKLSAASTVGSALQTLGLPNFAPGSGSGQRQYKFYGIALKQVRNANDPQKADYQASVWLERQFIPDDIQWLDADLELRIPEYPAISIAANLGLKREVFTPAAGEDWPHATRVYRVRPVARGVNKSASLVVSGKMRAVSSGIGWWRIGKDGWKGPGFEPTAV